MGALIARALVWLMAVIGRTGVGREYNGQGWGVVGAVTGKTRVLSGLQWAVTG